MIIPDWPAPKNIKAYTYTKLDMPPQVHLLQQEHSNNVITLPEEKNLLHADGVYTNHVDTPCSIKTADCLAILLCNQQGTEVAALHAGWRGLAQHIIAIGCKKFIAPPAELIAWLSPAICAAHYEIDHLVYDAFVTDDAAFASCFKQNRPGHWHCDLFALARLQLEQAGVQHIFGGGICTFEQEHTLYSYRREPDNPGRLIHTIWNQFKVSPHDEEPAASRGVFVN